MKPFCRFVQAFVLIAYPVPMTLLHFLEPVLLHRETIGTSSLVGAATFVALHQFSFGENICAIVGGAVVILTRVISIQFDLHLPKFSK